MTVPYYAATVNFQQIQTEFGGLYYNYPLTHYYGGSYFVPRYTIGYPDGVATYIPESGLISYNNFHGATYPTARNYRLFGFANMSEGQWLTLYFYADYEQNNSYYYILYNISNGQPAAYDFYYSAGYFGMGTYSNWNPLNVNGYFSFYSIADSLTEGNEYFRLIIYRPYTGWTAVWSGDFAVLDTSQSPPPSGSYGYTGNPSVAADSVWSWVMARSYGVTVSSGNEGDVSYETRTATYSGIGWPLVSNTHWGRGSVSVGGGGIAFPTYYAGTDYNYSDGPAFAISNPSNKTAVFYMRVRFWFESHINFQACVVDANRGVYTFVSPYYGLNQNTGGGSLGGWDGYYRWYYDATFYFSVAPYSSQTYYARLIYYFNGDYNYYHGGQNSVATVPSGFRYAQWTYLYSY